MRTTVRSMEGTGITTTHQTSDGRWLRVTLPDETTFEAMRHALDDPVWLLGASWELLTTNDFKRGRFDDAFGAWLERQDGEIARSLLEGAGAQVDEVAAPGD